MDNARSPLPETGFAKARSGTGVITTPKEMRKVAKPMPEDLTAWLRRMDRYAAEVFPSSSPTLVYVMPNRDLVRFARSSATSRDTITANDGTSPN